MTRLRMWIAGALSVFAAVGIVYATTVTTVNNNCGLIQNQPVAMQMACMRTMQWPTGFYGCTGNAATAQCDLAFGTSPVTQVRVNNCNSNADVFNMPGFGQFTAGYKCNSGLSGSLGSQSRNVWKGTVPTNSPLLVYKDGGNVLREYGYPGCCGSANQFYTYGL
jgi:hypothetical protein